jgi:hypothetical protein
MLVAIRRESCAMESGVIICDNVSTDNGVPADSFELIVDDIVG